MNRKILKSPVMINLEITSACNTKCRHCYNFFRDDNDFSVSRLSLEKMDALIDLIIKDNVFHVVLTGGEPLLNFDILLHAVKKLTANNISLSINSNLMLLDDTKACSLREAGIDHILTSLNSYDKKTNDYMVNQDGAFEKIIQGIKVARANAIRVSSNMIIAKNNKDHVYETAKLCASLGVQKIFGTRLVPSINVASPEDTDFHVEQKETLDVLDDLISAKEDFGIGIGSLISYPLCLLGDLQKYSDFVGRGCPAQRGNRMVINADGSTHACTHEEHAYGNVFEVGIKKAFDNMFKWHDGSYLYAGCNGCLYKDICMSGCRSASFSYFKEMDNKDPLFLGPDKIINDYKLDIPSFIKEIVMSNEKFIVPSTIRFRDENDFYSINVRWADSITVDKDIALFLIEMQQTKKEFNIDSLDLNDKEFIFKVLAFKEIIIPVNDMYREKLSGLKTGCSLNPFDLPEVLKNEI